MRKSLLRLPNVNGYSNVLHKRIRGGKEVDETVVRVYVTKKCNHSSGSCDQELLIIEHVPDRIRIGWKTYPSDVVEIGEVKALSVNIAKERPVPMGYSLGHYLVTAGTGGFVCWINDHPYILTNNHVGANQSSIQHPTALVGDPELQPGVYDKGTWSQTDAGDIFGTLFAFIPIDEINPNSVDSAIIRPFVDGEVVVPNLANTVNPTFVVGMTGSYVGRSSGSKTITITDPSAVLTVTYENYTAPFEDVVMFTPLAIAGDSGSGIYSADGRVWMEVFAGSPTNGVAIKMTNVLNAYYQEGIDISFTPPPLPPPFTPTTIKFISYSQTTYNGIPAVQVTLENDYPLPDLTVLLVAVVKNSLNQTVSVVPNTFVFNATAKQLTGTSVFANIGYGTYTVLLFCETTTGKPISPQVTLPLIYSPPP